MNLTSLKIFFCRNDVRVVIICTATGGILQVLSKRYLKSYPEFSKDTPVTKKKYRLPKCISPRGEAFIEISGISIHVVTKVVLNFVAKKGLLTGLGIVAIKIPSTAITKYLHDSFQQNLPHLEKRNLFWLVRKRYI